MEDTLQPGAAAPAQPAAVPAPESEYAAFEREETSRDLDRAAGKVAPPKPAAAAPAAPADDDAPALDAQGRAVTDAQGKAVSKRQQAQNDKVREAVKRGIAAERERADRLDRELQELRAKQAPAPPAKPETTPAADLPAWKRENRKPTRADFPIENFADQDDPYAASWEAFGDAKDEWKDLQHAAADEQRQRAAQEHEGAMRAVTTYQAREDAFKAAVPDFDEKTAIIRNNLNMRMPLAVALIESEAAPALILHFAEHLDEFQRIGALGAVNLPAALRELGKLEAKCSPGAPAAPAARAPKHVTDAPAPGTFLGSQPAPAADGSRAAVARGDFAAFDAEEISKDLARVGGRR